MAACSHIDSIAAISASPFRLLFSPLVVSILDTRVGQEAARWELLGRDQSA